MVITVNLATQTQTTLTTMAQHTTTVYFKAFDQSLMNWMGKFQVSVVMDNHICTRLWFDARDGTYFDVTMTIQPSVLIRID